MPTTVRRAVCATRPVASSTNTANVDERRNAGRHDSTSDCQETATVNQRSIGGILEHFSDILHPPMLRHVEDPVTTTRRRPPQSPQEITGATRVKLRNSSQEERAEIGVEAIEVEVVHQPS